MTVIYEGQSVVAVGGDNEGGRGHIVAMAGASSAHVKWATGPCAGDIRLTDIYDLDPITASMSDDDDDPMHFRAVAKAYTDRKEDGVVEFLATHGYTESWTKIAADVLEFTRQRIRTDASMELVEEQLTPVEQRNVVYASALRLLADAFGTEGGE